MKNLIAGLLAAYLWLSPLGVVAGTADGQTPADEDVCDVLRDHTPGLYGLCVAYCEAQDLDMTFDPAHPDVGKLAQSMPSQKILDAYNRKKGAGDPDMPCVQTPCPCWTAETIAASSWNGTGGICINAVPTSGIGTTFALIEGPHIAGVVSQFAPTPQDPRFDLCFYRELDAVPPLSIQFPVPTGVYQICKAQIEQTCDDLGYPRL